MTWLWSIVLRKTLMIWITAFEKLYSSTSANNSILAGVQYIFIHHPFSNSHQQKLMCRCNFANTLWNSHLCNICITKVSYGISNHQQTIVLEYSLTLLYYDHFSWKFSFRAPHNSPMRVRYGVFLWVCSLIYSLYFAFSHIKYSIKQIIL